MDRLMDSVHCLTATCRGAVVARLDRFESIFPQLFFAVYIDALPEGTSLREFGFWLLNRGAVGSIHISRPNENGIVLVLDLNARGASLSIGYGLERVLGQRVIANSLRGAGAAWESGDFGGGIVRCIDLVSSALRKKGRMHAGGNDTAAGGMPSSLKSIREGHRFASGRAGFEEPGPGRWENMRREGPLEP